MSAVRSWLLVLAFMAIATVSTAAAPALVSRQQSQIDSRSMDLFDRGQAEHAAGRLAKALELYDQSIALDPEFWGSHYQRGVALLQLDRPADAERSLRRAVELEDEFAAAHAALGDALLRLDRPTDAEKELSRALAIEPSLAGARLNYANALWKRMAYAEAERELARIASDGKASPDSELLRAQTLVALDRKEDALAALGRVLALDPKSVHALRTRGSLRATLGDNAGAVEDLAAAYALAPSSDLEAQLAEVQSRTGSADAVVEGIRARVAANPRDAEARRALASALVRADRLDEARVELEKFVESAPDPTAASDEAGDVLVEKAPLEAAAFYNRAVKLAPDNDEVRVKLGAALVRSKRYSDALGHFQLAARRTPDRREAHAGLAAAYYGTGRYAEAAHEFGWLSERDPGSTTVQFFLGASLDRIGDCQGALAAFRRFLGAADATKDKSRIEEVNLRVPALERLIERGGCKKRNAAS